MLKKKWFNEWYAACVDNYNNYAYYTWESSTIYFLNRFGVDGVSLPTNLVSLDDPIMKAWEYRMLVYLMEIPYPKYQFFSILTEFQWCMFKRIHWILTSPNNPTKVPYNRGQHVKVLYTVIEYEYGKAKPSQYLVQLVDLDNHN